MEHLPGENERDTSTLRRALNLPLLTLYGLGVTIGAGIYVLVGAAAARAGIYAPVSFLMAALVVGFTGLSYAELATRYPVSAGEAAYVRAGFNSRFLSLIVGLMVALSGIVSSAAISIGAAAYLHNFIGLPPTVLIVLVILLLGLASVWGIVESVSAAALFTLIEISGLLLVVWFGFAMKPGLSAQLPNLLPPFEPAVWSGIFSAGLLAFFAFVGFEDIANVAEEVKDPQRTLPRAILLTLVLATLLYLLVVAVVVLAVPMERLATSRAPLALVFEDRGPTINLMFTLIACFATMNGILVQMIMSSRVLYGLARAGSLPKPLAYVHPGRRTPLVASAVVVGLILLLALFFPIDRLAEGTSITVLIVFSLVNLALLLLKRRKADVDLETVYQVPAAIPLIGLASSLLMLTVGMAT